MNISEPVSVSLAYDHVRGKAYPKWVLWKNKLYAITKIGLHHTYREGATRYHIFSVTSATLFFILKFNTETLSWSLEEIEDN